LSGVVIVRKGCAINLHGDFAGCRIDAISAEQTAGGQGRIFVLLKCARSLLANFDFRTDAQITVRISGHRVLIDDAVFRVVT